MPEPHHLAFVLTRFARGGMEMRLADVVNRLDKSCWNPHVYAFYDHQTMRDAIEPDRLHTPLSAGKADLGVPFRLARIFRQHKTAVVWSLTQGLAAAWGRLGGIWGGVPIRILSIHDNYPLAPMTRLLNPWTEAIVTNSQRSAGIIRQQGIPADKLHVLYNGVDTQQYAPGRDRRGELLGIPPDRPVVLNVGRLFPEKGRDTMLQAAALLVERPNPPLIVFAGDGSQRVELEHLAAELGIRACVRFLGIRQDVPDLMRSSDVVVMSSRDVPFGESCPNVVLEGMASALPVVGTRVGGTAELILDGETGFVIPPENPSALAEKLTLLLDHHDLRRQMGEAGRRRVEELFSIERMLEGRVQLLDGLLKHTRLR
jgi:glycosyltransferase involved in cell wall biosynthesis